MSEQSDSDALTWAHTFRTACKAREPNASIAAPLADRLYFAVANAPPGLDHKEIIAGLLIQVAKQAVTDAIEEERRLARIEARAIVAGMIRRFRSGLEEMERAAAELDD